MRCHDEDLIQSETQYQMNEHIDTEARQTEPEETTLTTYPDASQSQQQNQGLNDIVKYGIIFDENRTPYQRILQKVLPMELKRFTKEVLIDRLPTSLNSRRACLASNAFRSSGDIAATFFFIASS